MFKWSPRVIEKYTRQAREEALQEGRQEGREEAREETNAQWVEWYRRAEAARQRGVPFDEPMPSETQRRPPKE